MSFARTLSISGLVAIASTSLLPISSTAATPYPGLLADNFIVFSGGGNTSSALGKDAGISQTDVTAQIIQNCGYDEKDPQQILSEIQGSSPEYTADALFCMGSAKAAQVANLMAPQKVAAAINIFTPDSAADILRRMEPAKVAPVLAALPKSKMPAVRASLQYYLNCGGEPQPNREALQAVLDTTYGEYRMLAPDAYNNMTPQQILQQGGPDIIAKIMPILDTHQAARTVSIMNPDIAAEILMTMDKSEVNAILADVPSVYAGPVKDALQRAAGNARRR